MATAIGISRNEMYQVKEVLKGCATQTDIEVGNATYRITDRKITVMDSEYPENVYWETAYTGTSYSENDIRGCITFSFDYINLITFYTV